MSQRFEGFDNSVLSDMFDELLEHCTDTGVDFSDFIGTYAQSNWTKTVARVRKVVNDVVEKIEEGQWVIVQVNERPTTPSIST